MIHFLSQPWPWYVTGPLLGLMVPILLFVGNKQFGISSSFRHLCAALLPVRASYFKYSWREESWNLFLVGGIIIGATVAALFLAGTSAPPVSSAARSLFASWGIQHVTGLVPVALYGTASLLSAKSLLALAAGGFFVGFGTRYANGCTAGHAIMGLSLLSPASLVATVGFFGGGLVVSNFVVPLLMAA
ncbi:MAG TPA: YeeE/YedE thiosulfate transporter family protein [Spirochaetia bacterium]|nr:YeeE/YedE thiosulfate transporter family protein [Spirochaetia bacterium]